MQVSSEGPKLKTFKDWIRQLFCGMCMGVADIIPGISGGTVAFIMGFYDDLLHSIKSVKPPFKNISWQFLLATLTGIAISMVTLANYITIILDHEVYRIYLYATFLGLILASIFFCGKQIRKWHPRYILLITTGAIIAYILCGTKTSSVVHEDTYDVYLEKSSSWTRPIANYDNQKQQILGVTPGELSSMLAKGFVSTETPVVRVGHDQEQYAGNVVDPKLFSWIDPWVVTCGVIGISALLLPGVSGSYVLNILGMYPIIIAALAEFVSDGKQLIFNLDAFLVLANLGIGIIFGAILFSRVIGWFLDHYHQGTLAILTGFLIGSLHVVWPFWSYEYLLNPLKIDVGPKLHAITPIIPTANFQVIAIATLLTVGGFILVFALETVAKKKGKETNN
jgi:putative membrane protein